MDSQALTPTLLALNRKERKECNQPVTARKMEFMQIDSYKEQLHSPFDWYRSMRTMQTVFKHPEWGGWQVFRYAEVTRLLNEF
jgi:hypothetical protein